MDRNNTVQIKIVKMHASLSARRAWIEIAWVQEFPELYKSLSARRAWIEIPAGCWRDARRAVALRKESVDRNHHVCQSPGSGWLSLSARRAWIEITYVTRLPRAQVVALRKESVDRNNGLKRSIPDAGLSLSARRAWIEIGWYWHFEFFCSGRSPQGERG